MPTKRRHSRARFGGKTRVGEIRGFLPLEGVPYFGLNKWIVKALNILGVLK